MDEIELQNVSAATVATMAPVTATTTEPATISRRNLCASFAIVESSSESPPSALIPAGSPISVFGPAGEEGSGR